MAKKVGPITRTLKAARKLIAREGGWAQGHYKVKRDKTTAYCAIGAIEAATKDSGLVRGATIELGNGMLGKNWVNVTTYNDHPRRKQEQVVALFDRAIKKAEAKGL